MTERVTYVLKAQLLSLLVSAIERASTGASLMLKPASLNLSDAPVLSSISWVMERQTDPTSTSGPSTVNGIKSGPSLNRPTLQAYPHA